MVKVAISIYGSNGFRHVLKSALCCALLVLVTACSGSAQRDAGENGQPLSTDSYSNYLSQAREIALAQTQVTVDSSGSQQLDTTSLIQASAPFELWMYLAIVKDDEGQAYALQQRFAKLRVKDEPIEKNSEWAFSQVVGVDVSLQNLSDKTSWRQQGLERAALDLAGVDGETNRVWVGAYQFSQAPDKASDPHGCEFVISLKSPELDVNFNQSQCTAIEKTKEIGVSRSSAMPVNGSYRINNRTLSVTGYGWVIHAWGIPPDDAATAVIFDRAWLLLDEQHEVQLQRSRRRSGRGAKITSAVLNELDNTLDARKLELTWLDGELGEHGLIPEDWQLITNTNDMDVRLTPVRSTSMRLGSTRSGSIEEEGEQRTNTTFDVVRVQGTHDGFGFVSYGAQ